MGMAAGLFMLIPLALSFMVIILIHHFLPLFLKKKTVPKGSFGWPFLGETLSFLNPHPSNSIGPFLHDHISYKIIFLGTYGKVFTSHLFFSPTVVSCDEELNYFILQNEGKLFEGSYPKSIHGILGKDSMLVAVSDTHKRLRNVALSLVTSTKSKPQFLNDVQTIVLQVLDSWLLKQQVIFIEEARKFTFNVIVKQVLGLTPEEAITKEILQDFQTFMRGLISLPLYIPGTPYARAVQARSRIFSSVRAIIEERIRRNAAENNCSSSLSTSSCKKKKNDFLDILIDIDTLSLDEKVSFVLDSLLGGYETTSLLISMVVFFLGHSSPALYQLKVEHENIRKMKKKDEFLNLEDYQKMDFTQKVINEALRSGNIVKFVHRKALKDIKFKDYVIPSGWKVLPILSAVHLDPAIHANPFHFNPWRWEDDQTCKKLTPFGGGSRCCPGSELAKVEVAFFLHYLVRNFRWTVADDEQPIAYPYVEFRRGLTINISRSSE